MAQKPSKKYPHEVTQAERDLFEASLRKWQKVLNLVSWRIELIPDSAASTAAADVEISVSDRLAKIRLAKYMRRESTPEELDSYALHEVLHVRFAELIHYVSEDADEKIIEGAEHDIIVLFDKILRK